MMEPGEHVEIVLFDVAGTRYGADMTQVRRIDRHDPHDSVGAPLGPCREGTRALVFSASGARDLHLAVDAVLGVRTVHRDELRRLPLAVGHSPYVIGAWLEQDQAVLLVDLHATNPFRPEAPHG